MIIGWKEYPIFKIANIDEVAIDCRAYVEDPEDILSKPLKCGFNPYTGEWSTNPLKQKAINFYGMREMVEGGGNESK